jgi:hypothetical protein
MRTFDIWLLFIFILNLAGSFFMDNNVATIAWVCAFMVQLRIVLKVDTKE